MSSGAHILSNSLKISDTTQAEFFKLKFFQIDKKLQPWKLGPCFRDFNMLTLHKSSDAGLFSDLRAHAFCGSIISEINELWGSSFFSKYSKFDIISEMEHKIQNILSTFEIIALSLVVLNTLFYQLRILVIGSPYVIKQFQDFRC